MKKMYKAMLLTLCAILLVAGSVVGTLAYLQMKTQTINNTFVAGKVSIALKEYGINADGTVNTSETVTTGISNIKLMPTREIGKNPFITVTKGSEECYLFVKVTENLGTYATINWDTSKWKPLDGAAGYYYYTATVNALNAAEDIKVDVFNKIICANVTAYPTDVEFAVEITAYAVQAAGFNTAAEAWAAANFS